MTEEWHGISETVSKLPLCSGFIKPDPSDEWKGEVGFIADVISRKLEDMQDMDAYLCGPPIMIETTCDVLYKGGMKGTNISYDEF